MKQNEIWIPFLTLLLGCSNDERKGRIELKDNRVFIAQGNVSFILPDSTLTKGQTLIKGLPLLWPPDSAPDGSYGEAGVFYHNADTTKTIQIYVTAMPGNKYYPELPWRVYADEEQHKYDLMALNRGLAVFERFVADSASRSVEINYHLPKRAESGWKGQASYQTFLELYGRFRTIKCHFSGPDNAKTRQEFSAIRSSLFVNPAYLASIAKSYPQREYQD